MGDLIETFYRDSVSLKEQIVEICSYMNGGIELNSAWGMSFEDREIAVKIINRRLKDHSTSGKEYM